MILDFPAWLRATHVLNLLFLSLLVRSGLEILSAHPKLYWNDDCTPGSEWLRLTRRQLPAGGSWTSHDEEESFPSWIALPGRRNLGLGRHWHFLVDAGWVLTGLLYVVMLAGTGEWRRIVPTSWAVVPAAWAALLEYLHLHLVVTPGRYNALEQLAYFAVVFLLSPLAMATGLAMSPSLAARHPGYLRLFGGRQAARSIHFLCLGAFLAFSVVHLVMVIAHGVNAQLALIVLGDLGDVHGALGLLVGVAGLGVIVLVHVVGTWGSLRHPRAVQRGAEAVTRPLRRALFGHGHSVQAYAPHEVSPCFRVNGRPPAEAAYAEMVRDGFAGYALEVDGLVERPLRLSLAELRAMPASAQVTKHCCIQGWSAVAKWRGVALSEIVQRCRPHDSARFLVFHALDDKATSEPEAGVTGTFYGTIAMELAAHPQTILAYEMNDRPLPVEHGAPLRLRVETQLGFTMVKYLRRIEFVEDYRQVGGGYGGWREDHQYYSQEAGI